ncbi:MAG: hypothetical protein IT290_00245, partial [Deltaproteobacteria bacterium]|nr:hypothetical protein [Deltaproteobacteria bacterium]
MTPKTEGGFASLGSLVIVPLLLGIAMIAFVPASTLIEEYEARQLAEHVALTAAQALPDLSEAQRRGVATLHSSGRHRLDGAVSASERIPGAIDVRVSFQSTAGILLTTLFGHAQSNIVAAHAVVGLRPLNVIIIVPDGPTLAPRTGSIEERGAWMMHEDEERFAQCPKDALGFAPWKQCQNPILSQVKLAALTLLDHLQENALSHTSVQFYPGDPSRDLDPQEIAPGAAFTRLDVDCARLGATLADSIPYALPSSPFRASSPQCEIVPF